MRLAFAVMAMVNAVFAVQETSEWKMMLSLVRDSTSYLYFSFGCLGTVTSRRKEH